MSSVADHRTLNKLEGDLLGMVESGLRGWAEEKQTRGEKGFQTADAAQPPKWLVDVIAKLHGLVTNRLKVAPVQNLVDLDNLEPKDALKAIMQAQSQLSVESDRLKAALRLEASTRALQ